MTDPQPAIVESLLDAFGRHLYGLGEFQQDDYELLYITDDAVEDYSADRLENIWRDLLLETLRKEPLEDQFPTGGEYRYTAIGFDRMAVFLLPRSRASGLVVAVDSDYFDDVDEVLAACREHL